MSSASSAGLLQLLRDLAFETVPTLASTQANVHTLKGDLHMTNAQVRFEQSSAMLETPPFEHHHSIILAAAINFLNERQ